MIFAGLGDLVRELRELWKDVRWRNRVERELAELDLLERRLELELLLEDRAEGAARRLESGPAAVVASVA